MLDEEGRQYHDLITFQPHLIMNITSKQRNLLDEYGKIVNALRDENKTVKELHQLYYDPEARKYDKTIKTIYRYVGILEEEKLITAAGQRVTEGSRVVEKVYSISARFFHDSTMGLEFWTSEESKIFASNLGYILSEVTENPAFNQATGIDTIHKVLKITSEQDYFNILEILEKGRRNGEIEDMIKSNYREDRKLITHASNLLIYLRSFNFIEELNKIGDIGLNS